MPRRITVVLSQGPSNRPAKRKVEEDLVAGLLGNQQVEVTVVPHLYHLAPTGTGMLCLAGVEGDIVVCSWLFPRAAHWVLDRHDVRGRVGQTQLADADETRAEPGGADLKGAAADDQSAAGAGRQQMLPDRTIYCLDLRGHDSAAPYLEEIGRIAAEAAVETVPIGNFTGPGGQLESRRPYTGREAETGSASGARNGPRSAGPAGGASSAGHDPTVVDEQLQRRWYPVIDFSLCTNCMECIDFCLFGVYGVDQRETIVVEQPDNCRKGCPACSRVCPEHAIIFPDHKSPAIAGNAAAAGELKIDLSQLFGAPSAAETATRERDEQLRLTGHETVETAAALPELRRDRPARQDDLDDLINAVDEMDL